MAAALEAGGIDNATALSSSMWWDWPTTGATTSGAERESLHEKLGALP